MIIYLVQFYFVMKDGVIIEQLINENPTSADQLDL